MVDSREIAPKYSQHFETLVALVTYLGFTGGGHSDAAFADELASHLGLDELEVSTVLQQFKGLFRRSELPHPRRPTEHKYALQLRYARRKYVDGEYQGAGEPLNNDDLFALLEFISNRVREEQESERHYQTNRITMIGALVAAAFSVLAAFIGLIK
jgi:hypothetical protein